MRIFIKAKPNAREEKIEKIDDLNYVVSVEEPPIKGWGADPEPKSF